MRILIRAAVVTALLTSSAGLSAATYILGYRQGLEVNSTRATTPAPSVQAQRPPGGLRQVTASTVPFEERP